MGPIPKSKLRHLSELADKSLHENADAAFISLFSRTFEEVVETVSNAFNTLGMFRMLAQARARRTGRQNKTHWSK